MASKVGYIYSDELTKFSDSIPNHCHRSYLTHSLVKAYGLHSAITEIIPPETIERDDLLEFHDQNYIDGICDPSSEQNEEHGLEYDCARIDNLDEYVLHIASSSITAAKELQNFDVIINWDGGRHHAAKSRASGFCFVNDVVLCIERLLLQYSKVLYIDLDVHHGNGVQDAFYWTDKVMCLSVHLFEAGFYPQTGTVDEIGEGKGKYSNINIPLKRGLGGLKFKTIVIQILKSLFKSSGSIYNPIKYDCIVLQCGVDTLPRDPLGGFNITKEAIGEVIEFIINLNNKVIILGGGGYNPVNVSKAWTYLTSRIVGIELSRDIPEFDDWAEYAPDYSLDIGASKISDENSDEYIDGLIKKLVKSMFAKILGIDFGLGVADNLVNGKDRIGTPFITNVSLPLFVIIALSQ